LSQIANEDEDKNQKHSSKRVFSIFSKYLFISLIIMILALVVESFINHSTLNLKLILVNDILFLLSLILILIALVIVIIPYLYHSIKNKTITKQEIESVTIRLSNPQTTIFRIGKILSWIISIITLVNVTTYFVYMIVLMFLD